MTTPSAPPAPDLRTRLAGLTLRDEQRLGRRLDRLRGIRDQARCRAETERIEAELAEAEEAVARRRAAAPVPTYPAELPVSQRRDDIAAAIRDHQVVIVAGETGSGKTTQLPKICLELGRGVRGLIGHTQPRRIAARTVAARIAEELNTAVGGAVGFQVRFTGRVGPATMVKLMTDGILLAETQHDPLLHAYDTLIIDEAHERSLNIDFILGYLKQLLPRRPDLKVIITSATIDPERFAVHFGQSGVDAPIVEVSGRTYPVEVRYRPLVEQATVDDDEVDEEPDERPTSSVRSTPPTDRTEPGATDLMRDQIQAICDAVDELCAEGTGDILVFLSGEREIRDTADALRRQERPHTEVLPLFARLSTAEQHRVFAAHTGRRIVLATNVAETSLTVPGIRYVVDPGTARISRYSQRLKVQRLPIEPVSQASANQRKGRCGRTSPGICVRLYDEADFLSRPEFTEPEILRTNLASVILQMAALGLGDLAAFPFVEPPDRRSVNDGVALLQELGAFSTPGADKAGPGDNGDNGGGERRLTPLGRRLAQLPVDPRLGRMLLEAQTNGCVREVLVITAALSIQDPRERPLEHQQAAAQAHARFRDPESDFTTLLNLWGYLQEQQAALSSNQFRRLCRAEYLNYLRVREWQDLESQLRQVCKGMGIGVADAPPAPPVQVHQSLLAGLLSHVGVRDLDKPEYTGARGARFAIFPGSALYRRNTRWVMAAELVETSRLWGRTAARIEPEWAERLAAHLVKRSYSEPHWERDQGSVVAMEKVTLYGLPLVAARKVQYGRIDPVMSRELFIRHALVEGDWRTRHEFFHANRAMLDDVEELEARARRRDMLVDDETLFAFYDERIGAEVVSAQHFDSWWKRIRRAHPDLLSFSAAMLMNERSAGIDPASYPDVWHQGELALPLSYQFEPGTAADGVTVHVPLAVLPQVRPDGFDWQIPGLRAELVTALLRTLPKALRRYVVPVPDHTQSFLDGVRPGTAPLLDALETYLHRLGVQVNRRDWDLTKVPEHLRVTFQVEDDGKTVAEGKDLAGLRRQLAPRSREVLAEAADGVEQDGLTAWTPGTLAKVIQRRRAGYSVTAYPALVDQTSSVAVRVFDTEADQARAMWAGTRRLLLLEVPTPIPLLSKRLSNAVKLGLTRYPYQSVPDLLEECVRAAVDAIMTREGGPTWDDEAYRHLREAARADLPAMTIEIVVAVEKVVAATHDVRTRLAAPAPAALAASIEDMRAQLVALVQPGFVTVTGKDRLADLPRYLRGIEIRLQRLPTNAARDREWMDRVGEVRAEYDALLAALPPHRREDRDVRDIRWMIEELRISYFAQEVRTPYPVSDVRIYRVLDAIS